jgi:aromatic amino acid transport protein
MYFNKTFGSILMLIGITIGAGILALPLISAKSGFIFSGLALIGIWALMAYTGLLILEVNLAFPVYRNNFSSMSKMTLGRWGYLVTWISCIALLYALASAYIAGNSSLLSAGFKLFFHLNVPKPLNALFFTVVFGGAVFWSTRIVDHVNRYLLTVKAISLIAAIVLLMPHVNIHLLINRSHQANSLFASIPVFLCAFGYHTIIPSLSNYLGRYPKKLKKVIIIGASVPLIFYLLWMFVTLTIVPLVGQYSFESISTNNHASLEGLMYNLYHLIQSKWVNIIVNVFSDIAMTTSFLGVTLGLFDFLADHFKRLNTTFGRLQTAVLTFIPPLLFACFYPNGFIMALRYVAIFVAILEVILPALMVWFLRRQPERFKSPYRVWGNNVVLGFVILCGFLLITIQFFNL